MYCCVGSGGIGFTPHVVLAKPGEVRVLYNSWIVSDIIIGI